MSDHQQSYERIVLETVEAIRRGDFSPDWVRTIVDGIKQELQQCVQFKWFDDSTRQQLENQLDAAETMAPSTRGVPNLVV
jgi:hypothetical protein